MFENKDNTKRIEKLEDNIRKLCTHPEVFPSIHYPKEIFICSICGSWIGLKYLTKDVKIYLDARCAGFYLNKKEYLKKI